MSITRDRAYCAEIVPPNLAKLIGDLCEFFHIPQSHVGCKGDSGHRRGYHRSRRFLEQSVWASNRRYSVAEKGNRGGDPNWLSALDISLDSKRLILMCRRLDRAVRAGQLEKVAEWYGNTGGDNRVDGYDNVRNAVASSDSSHLWHAHISLIRSHANDDHTDLFSVLTGTRPLVTASLPATAPVTGPAKKPEQDDDMDPNTAVPVPANKPFPGYIGTRKSLPAGELWHGINFRVNSTEKKIDVLADQVDKLTALVSKLLVK